MALNEAEYIEGLSASDPKFNDLIKDVASHLRAIKKSLQQTFPSFTGPLTEGADWFNGLEGRIGALEATYAAYPQLAVASGELIVSSTGSQVVTGVGFQPSALIIFGNSGPSSASANASVGVADGTQNRSVGIVADGASTTGDDQSFYNGTRLWDLYGALASNFARGTLTSMDADGFTLNASVASADAHLTWIAID